LREHPAQRFTRFETLNGRPVLRLATADVMRPECVACHNSHPDSPRVGWKAGDVRGVLEVIRPLHGTAAETRRSLTETFVLLGCLGAAGVGGLALVIGRLRRNTAELAQRYVDLAEVNRALADSNVELERFAYVVSHDLQEPLRMVSSFTQLVSARYGGKLDKEADEFIGFASAGASRMQRLLTGLLSYSRATGGTGTLEPVELEDVMGAVKADLRIAIQESRATVTSAPLPRVLGQTEELHQVLQNLIANALKFHGAEPPRVHVSATRQGDRWQVSVRDNGIGIERSQHERVFEMFRRLHKEEEYPGAGVGLAICKRIVERRQGRIWVESEPGRGATFHFTVPAAPS
jgi:light-regulated signal transduction histidine kinase (bacteriophytochrome)